MLEKIISFENIATSDFFGDSNRNIKELASAFPKSKIFTDYNSIVIQGDKDQINQIEIIIRLLFEHFENYGKLTIKDVLNLINQGNVIFEKEKQENLLFYGNKGVKIFPKSKNQTKILDAINRNDLVFVVGPAGTGKTFFSVALAVQALKNKTVKKIIITRPAVETGENLGFLPGDLKEKIFPYLRPIYDALGEMLTKEKLQYYFENNMIEIIPLAYMRGLTLKDAFVLLDEAQNSTHMQMKMFLTRMGVNSKMIITGDISQIDLPRNQRSGLVEALQILKNINGIEVVELQQIDVVRHHIVKKIITAYQKTEKLNS